GGAAGTSGAYGGGTGGSGRIAVNYATSISGSTSPAYETASTPAYNYSVFISDEIATPNSTEYNKLRWIADLTNYGNIEIQTRSGKTPNSTDNTWETWKPNASANNLSLENADTHTNWVANRPSTTTYSSDNLGSGSDGAITVSSNTSINTTNIAAARLAASPNCVDGGDAVNYSVTALTSTTATLESAPSTNCLAIGDEMLLINLRGNSTAYGNVGNWETLYVQGISSNIVTFTTAKTKFYGDGTSDDTNVGVGTGAQAVMLQRVPNYTTVTVNATINFYPDAWVLPTGVVNNGAGEGGVMFFRATGAVAINGTIHANSRGYIGGTAGGVNGGGDGGETFCNPDGGGDGGNYNTVGIAGLCGGGGGGGSNQGTIYAGAAGTASLGGAGGGGGGSYDPTYGSYGGGGAGGGYGSAGAFGYGGNNGTSGGTNSSGNGGNGWDSTYDRGGGGGGGGTYGDANLTDLMFGSSGGGGGGGLNYPGGAGGTGGGIVYIAANSVTVSGGIQANGGAGGNATSNWWGGGGGGGAGGSVKIVGNSLTLGASLTTSTGGAAGTSGAYGGGTGGSGRIAVNYATSISGSTSPAYTSGTFTTNPTTITSVEEGNVTRNVNYYEDEDEPTATNITKLNLGWNTDLYAETRIAAKNLTNYDYLTAWVRSGSSGNTVTMGFGESSSTEKTKTFYIEAPNTWQKIYWDISKIPPHEKDEIRLIRASGSNMYIDNVTAN
ncbi:hypothetical protein KKH50_04710, partial [Patescibacteria group bacterium]|nr:hypothetical protein [Patescibacteria group bacterium]